MLKTAAIVLLFAACALAGAERAARLSRRHAALTGVLSAGERVLARVTMLREPLPVALATETGAPAFAAFAAAMGEGKSAALAAEEAAESLGAALTKRDRAAAAALFAAFSATDTRSLQRRYEQAASELTACAEEAEHDKREKAKLYRAMGVLLGAASAILLW